MLISTIVFACLLGSIHRVGAGSLQQSSKGIATVNLQNLTGGVNTLASGWIYGFPDNGTRVDYSIPDNLIEQVVFHSSRAGGAQIPARGWVASVEDYIGRFNSTLSNYHTTRHYGGTFILLVHDLWGADGGSISTFPGDDGNWTLADEFLKRLAEDIQRNDMLEGLVLDLWNEPDGSNFWDRSWDQYLEYWQRSYHYFKRELARTLISGPSMAAPPKLDDEKWLAWLAKIASSQTIPDIYSWHQIGAWSREPDTTVPDFVSMKAAHSLPDLPIDINEYAYKTEQNPANSVYYIAQLERHNLRGLRANWGSGSDLHDYLANLVFKSNGKYYPNGEWELYKYYAQMGGIRLATTASTDQQFDVFATKTNSTIKIMAGTRSVHASYEIQISGLQSVGLPVQGSVRVNTLRFDWKGDRGFVDGPVDLGPTSLKYSSDILTILVNPPDNTTAFAYEIEV